MWARLCFLLPLALGVLPFGLPTRATAQAPPGPAAPFTPGEAVLAAARDVASLPPEVAAYTRYLWAGDVPAANRATVRTVFNGHVNGMSTETDLTPLYAVPGTGDALWRLNLLDYAWKAETFDAFAVPDEDPYFYTHRDIKKADGKTRTIGLVAPELAETPALRTALTLLLERTHTTLSKEWNQVGAPIASVRFFAFKTMVMTNGRPTYNEFLGFKNEADFQRIGGVRKDDTKFAEALLAAVAESGVTLEPRALERDEKIGGAYWRSFDVAEGVRDANPLTELGKKGGKIALRFKASEQYLHLANGLWAMCLVNNKGEVQTRAPDDITTGDVTSTNPRDHRVHCPLSCVRCHADGGLQDIDEYVRNLLTPPPGFNLQTAEYKKAKELRQQYLRTLGPFLTADRARYAAALLAITGMKPQEYAAAYGEVWTLLCEPRIDLEWAAADLFVTPEALALAIDRNIRVTGATNTVLAGFLRPGRGKRPIQLRQWFEQIPTAQLYLRGLVPVPGKN